MSNDIRRVVNSHKAIGHLRPDRNQRWVVLTYSLKNKPTTMYGLFNVLRSFPTQREAEDYAQRIRTVTQSTSVIARPACTWLKLTTEIELEHRESTREIDEQLEEDHERMSEENRKRYKEILEQNALDKLEESARGAPSGRDALRAYMYKVSKTKSDIDDAVKHLDILKEKYVDYMESVALLYQSLDWHGDSDDVLEATITHGNTLATEGCDAILLKNILLPSMRGVVHEVNGIDSPLSRKDSPHEETDRVDTSTSPQNAGQSIDVSDEQSTVKVMQVSEEEVVESVPNNSPVSAGGTSCSTPLNEPSDDGALIQGHTNENASVNSGRESTASIHKTIPVINAESTNEEINNVIPDVQVDNEVATSGDITDVPTITVDVKDIPSERESILQANQQGTELEREDQLDEIMDALKEARKTRHKKR
jgi:hypothetical protein